MTLIRGEYNLENRFVSDEIQSCTKGVEKISTVLSSFQTADSVSGESTEFTGPAIRLLAIEINDLLFHRLRVQTIKVCSD